MAATSSLSNTCWWGSPWIKLHQNCNWLPTSGKQLVAPNPCPQVSAIFLFSPKLTTAFQWSRTATSTSKRKGWRLSRPMARRTLWSVIAPPNRRTTAAAAANHQLQRQRLPLHQQQHHQRQRHHLPPPHHQRRHHLFCTARPTTRAARNLST